MFTEEINISALIRRMLTSFLISMANGTSIDQFIQGNDDVRRFISDYLNLSESRLSLCNQIEDLQEQITRATDIMEAQALSINNDNREEMRSLLMRALSLLGEEPEELTRALERDEEVREADDSVVYNPDLYTIHYVENESEDVDDEDVDDEDVDDEDVDVDVEDIDVDDEDVDLDDEDLDLDDEDLENVVEQDQIEEVSIVKHPDITDNFVSLEDSHMKMFICVRYSYLPYHYTVNGVRFKLVVDGSQIAQQMV